MIDDTIQERLRTTGDAIDVPPGTPIEQLYARARVRRRRRQGASALTALSVAAIAGWGITQIVTVPDPGVVVSAPEQIPDLVIADGTLWESSTVEGAAQAAEQFARAAFGWQHVDVALLQGDDPRELSSNGGEIAELTGPQGQSIEVVMVPADGDPDAPGVWRIGQVGPHLWDASDPDRPALQLGGPEAAYAIVQFATGDGQQHRTDVDLDGGEAIDLDLTAIEAALVIYIDDNGVVLDAAGGVFDPGP